MFNDYGAQTKDADEIAREYGVLTKKILKQHTGINLQDLAYICFNEIMNTLSGESLIRAIKKKNSEK